MSRVSKSSAGRPKVEGDRHSYTVAQDAHEWIMAHGGGEYLTTIVRVIKLAKEGRL